MLTVGTGVGGGLVLNGRPYRGATGAAAELGHMLIGLDLEGDVPGPRLVPAAGIARVARRRVGARPARAGRRRPSTPIPISAGGSPPARRVTGHDVVDGAKDGDEVAIGLLATLGERLGIGIANVINALDPDVVAIGGGVSNAGDLLLEPARRTRGGLRAARSGNQDRDQAVAVTDRPPASSGPPYLPNRN